MLTQQQQQQQQQAPAAALLHQSSIGLFLNELETRVVIFFIMEKCYQELFDK